MTRCRARVEHAERHLERHSERHYERPSERHSPDDDAERSRRFERECLLESKRLEEGTARAACVDEHVERRCARSTQGRQFLDLIDLAPEAYTYPEQQTELEERMLQLCIDRSGALRGISKSSIHGGTLGGTRSEAIRKRAVPGDSSGVIRSHQESSGVSRSHQEASVPAKCRSGAHRARRRSKGRVVSPRAQLNLAPPTATDGVPAAL